MKQRYSILFVLAFFGILVVQLRTLVFDPFAIEDSFYLRPHLVRWVANLRVSLGDRVFPKVLVGDDGWLVFTGEGDLDTYQRSAQFSNEELAGFQQNLDALAVDYAKRGITLLVIVPPSKNTIYPERVPTEIPVLGNQSKLDQMVTYLQQHGQTQIIDLRPGLLAAKQEREMYYATDTHWNDYGVYMAYSALMTELQKVYPNLAPRPLSDFKVVDGEPELMDLAENIGTTLLRESKVQFVANYDKQTHYKTINLSQRKLVFSSNPDESLPDLVMYYDSFFFQVVPLLGEHFHNGYFIQNFSGGGLWNLSWVDEQQPDVVIIEMAERYLDDLPHFLEPER